MLGFEPKVDIQKFEPTISWSEGIGSTTVLRPLPNYGGIAPPRIPFILQFCWSQDICYLTSNRWFPKWRFFAKLFHSKDQVTLVFCSWHSSCTSSTGWSWFRDHTGRAWARGRGPARCPGLLGIAALPDGPTETSSCGWKHQRWCRYHQPVAVSMSTFKAFGHCIYLITLTAIAPMSSSLALMAYQILFRVVTVKFCCLGRRQSDAGELQFPRCDYHARILSYKKFQLKYA